MKWFSGKNRYVVFIFVFVVLFIAGILDIIFEGLFYQLLPSTLQSFFDGILRR